MNIDHSTINVDDNDKFVMPSKEETERNGAYIKGFSAGKAYQARTSVEGTITASWRKVGRHAKEQGEPAALKAFWMEVGMLLGLMPKENEIEENNDTPIQPT